MSDCFKLLSKVPAMATRHIFPLFLVFLLLKFQHSTAQSWIKSGHWYAGGGSTIHDIDSALFSHLICGFIDVNPSTYQLSIPKTYEQYFSSFTNILRSKNPSLVTLMSVWNGQAATSQGILGKKADTSVLSSMLGSPSSRKSFVDSSTQTARRYGFQGIDLHWLWPQTVSDMTNLGILLGEWRAAVNSESKRSKEPPLILAMALYYLPITFGNFSYPIDSMRRNLDWGYVVAYLYHLPSERNFTQPHASLYDPLSHVNTDFGIREWIRKGCPSYKLLLGLPFFGYRWALEDPEQTSIGSPSRGMSMIDESMIMSYKYIKWSSRSYGVSTSYNDTFVVNHITIGLTWINFDDVDAIRTKVAYAKENKLLGYNVFHVNNDDNSVLSRAAAQMEETNLGNRQKSLLIIVLPVSFLTVVVASLLCCLGSKLFNSKAIMYGKSWLFEGISIVSKVMSLEDPAPGLEEFSFAIIKAATNDFSSENKLGEGGFGPVYRGKLQNEEEIAVKRLSKTSNQGLQEFKNEVTLTGRLQHVNLVRLLGHYSEGDEKMLIYEYMPNKSLDQFLFDQTRSILLDWRKRINIIEGITQGILYLHEYSNFSIIHRDLKASNILLDSEMNPKISDLGMARFFKKDKLEATTKKIVGTYGYVPPEYVRNGIYSTKLDVYSFGVLLLQIISGKKNSCSYGTQGNLNLLEYAYELWKEGKGVEFVDISLDDTASLCKIIRCMQVALLCVQENPADRPSILEVSSMIKTEAAVIGTPKQPAFSTNRDGDAEEVGQCRIQVASVNCVTITQQEPR